MLREQCVWGWKLATSVRCVSVHKARQAARRNRLCFRAVCGAACGSLLCRDAFTSVPAEGSETRRRSEMSQAPFCIVRSPGPQRVVLALGTSWQGRVLTARATRRWLSFRGHLAAHLRLVGGRGCCLPHLQDLHEIGIGELPSSLPEPLATFLRVPQLRGHTLLLRLQVRLFFFQTLDAGEEVALLAAIRGGRLSGGARRRHG